MSTLNQLRWRCRRGTLELDLMLLRYLERCYPTAAAHEQQAFLRLLGLEDSELMHYLLGEQLPTDLTLAALVTHIRNLPLDAADQ